MAQVPRPLGQHLQQHVHRVSSDAWPFRCSLSKLLTCPTKIALIDKLHAEKKRHENGVDFYASSSHTWVKKVFSLRSGGDANAQHRAHLRRPQTTRTPSLFSSSPQSRDWDERAACPFHSPRGRASRSLQSLDRKLVKKTTQALRLVCARLEA